MSAPLQTSQPESLPAAHLEADRAGARPVLGDLDPIDLERPPLQELSAPSMAVPPSGRTSSRPAVGEERATRCDRQRVPWRSTVTRSHRSATSSSLWDTKSTISPSPASVRRAEKSWSRCCLGDAGGRLVEDQHVHARARAAGSSRAAGALRRSTAPALTSGGRGTQAGRRFPPAWSAAVRLLRSDPSRALSSIVIGRNTSGS